MVVENIKKSKCLIPIVLVLLVTILVIISKPWEVHAQGVTKVAELPFPIRNACCAKGDDGNIYIFGGIRNPSPYSSYVIRFNPTDKSVDTVADLGKPFYCGWAVNYSGKIYAGGGNFGSQPTKVIIIYNPADNSVNTITAPSPLVVNPSGDSRGNIGAFTYNGNIYVFFGSGTKNVKIYKVSDNTVTRINYLYLSSYTLATLNDVAYITSEEGVTTFDPRSNLFARVAEFPHVWGMSAVFGSDNMMYVIGGFKHGGMVDGIDQRELKADIIKYDPVNKTHTIAGSLPVPRAYSCAALANGKIYIFGGADNAIPSLSNLTADILEIDPSVLAAPPGELTLSGAISPENDIELSWSISSNASNYIVEKSTDGISYNQIEQTNGNTYIDSDLEPGIYYYRIRAQNDNGERLSNVITLTVQEPIPDIPDLFVTLDDADAKLTWTSVEGATKYILERSTDGINFKQLRQTSGNTHTDPGLTPGKYYYRVSAGNSTGMSEPSNIVSVTIPFIPPSKHWAYWPSGGQYVKVDWLRGNIDLSGDMVQLWREDTVSGVWLPVKDISEQEKDSFAWIDTNVSMGLNYKYQVRVYDPATWEWHVAAESEWAVEDRPFPAPSGLRILSTNDTSATITWNAVSGATGYRIKISTDGGSNWDESTSSSKTANVPCPCMVQVIAGNHARSQWSGVLRVQ